MPGLQRRLQLSAGELVVDVHESAREVHIHYFGAKPTDAEDAKLRAWLWPIVDAYRDDTRPMRITSAHASLGGVVETDPTTESVVAAYHRGIEAGAARC